MADLHHIEDPKGRLFAIGDIHGCADEIDRMLNFMEDDLGFSSDDMLVFVGDYMDRGPDSKGVVDRLLSFRTRFPDSVVFLKGNHEDMFLDFLGYKGRLGDGYLGNGGRECLVSYQIPPRTAPEVIAQMVPKDHLEFYLGLKAACIHKNFVFVHAGLNPMVPLYEQDEEDLYWIREEFIDFSHRFSQTVVFGHTPFTRIFFDFPYKIGIDTGLVFGNLLSCVELKEGLVFQLERNSKDIFSSRMPRQI